MDIFWIFISCIMVLGLSKKTDAGCAQDLQSDAQFQTCVMGYGMFIGNAVEKMDPNDPNAMMNLMCSTEGKQKIACVLTAVDTCPDLMTSGNYATMLQSLQTVKQMGGVEGMCSIIQGPCAAIQECVTAQSLKLQEGLATPSNPPTPFSLFQSYAGYICGPLKNIFECLKNADEQCSIYEAEVRGMLEKAGEQLSSESTWPTYDQTKMFALQECPTLPTDFSTNKCVMDNLKTDNFVMCFQNVSMTYPTHNNKVSCDAYKAGHNCVSMYVGTKCGSQYTKGFEKITPLFMAGIPTTCKIESSDPNGASLIQMSTFALLVAVILAFKLK